MRIGINGRFLVAKRTGVQRAAYNVIKTLIHIDRLNEYVIFTGGDQARNPDWIFANVQVVPSGIRPGDSLRNHFWEQFVLPRLAEEYEVDLLYSPANLAPFFYSGKSVIHIYDFCFVVNPQWYSLSFRTLYNFLIPRLARRAARVITSSNNSRNDLLQFCGVEAEQVSMVYLAVDDTFSAKTDGDSQRPKAFPDDYILYVGSLEPRKNIGVLVEAYERLRAERPELNTKLILIGGESPLFADVRLRVKRFKDDVIFKGFVEDTELRQYYRHATLVAYPSLYEGFGLPPLEAMASGTPVVTSSTSSLPEVVGDAALKVNPYDSEQLTQAMFSIISNPELRADLVRRGLDQVKRFNWYHVARNTLAVFYEVSASKGSEAAGTRGRRFIPFSLWRELTQLAEHQSLCYASSSLKDADRGVRKHAPVKIEGIADEI